MYFIYMINNYFFLGNLLIVGLFNSFERYCIVKLLPNPNVFLLLIAVYANISYGVLTLKQSNHYLSASNFLFLTSFGFCPTFSATV